MVNYIERVQPRTLPSPRLELDKTYYARPLTPSSFPLADLFLLSGDLKSWLEIITFKGPAVLELKNSIFLKLQNIDHKLKIVKRVWNKELATVGPQRHWYMGSLVKQVKFLLKLTQTYTDNTSPAHHYTAVLQNVNLVLQVTFFMVTVCHVLLGVSHCGCTFMLQIIQYIIHLTLLHLSPDLSQGDDKLLSDIPSDPQSSLHSICTRFILPIFLAMKSMTLSTLWTNVPTKERIPTRRKAR